LERSELSASGYTWIFLGRILNVYLLWQPVYYRLNIATQGRGSEFQLDAVFELIMHWERIMMCDTSRKGQFCFVVGFILTLALSAMTVQAATFVTVNGEAVIEAENYTRLSGSFPGPWFFSSTLPGYRGSGYMRS
jgi:hypothetical protein